MGLFTRRRSITPVQPRQAAPTVRPKLADIVIVGEASYQPHILKVRDQHTGQFSITLRPEPQNPFDANAVAVIAMGGVVGYLPREMAAWWQPAILQATARGQVVTGVASCSGGDEGRAHVGVFGQAYWPGPGKTMPRSKWEKYTDRNGTRR